jgi:hypothetical protein
MAIAGSTRVRLNYAPGAWSRDQSNAGAGAADRRAAERPARRGGAGGAPATIDIPNDDAGTVRYCLSELSQKGTTAAYSFLYAV